MININSNTVAVETATELKNILEGDNIITTIYLANDITLTSGIDILGTKQKIIIDGLYPTDGTGKIHTYTDMNSAGSGDVIGIRTASSMQITVKNMKVIGRNYYGIIYVSEGTNHQNVIVTYDNITYTGPQITYHPSGLSIYNNLNITIVDSPACVANEVAETAKLQIGGNTTIVHNSVGDSTFWFRGYTNDAYLEILNGANLSITTTRDVIYTQYYVRIDIAENAKFTVNTKYGMFRDSSHQASNITVGENSTFSIVQQARNSNYATIYCRGIFTISNNATLYMQANYDSAGPLIRFNTSSSKFNITNPKSVILYNKSSSCLSFESTSIFNILCRRIDYWLISPVMITQGKIDGTPIYSWYKDTEENISIICSVTSSKTTITSNNLIAIEIAKLPSLDLLQFQSAHTLRLSTNGTLSMENAPSIIEFQRPIISTNPVILGRKDEVLNITVIDSRAVSTTWYLYAYIDEPLTTSDNKYTLPDSLIFIGDDKIVQTLSKTPTLVYTGSSNDGNPKTTNIVWQKSNGILFKANKPLYNGKKYSTKINWKLTTTKL